MEMLWEVNSNERWRNAPFLATVALAAAAGALLVGCFRWPMVNDVAAMNYIAWSVGEGAVPYRDLLDMNFPGTYLVHRAVLGLPLSFAAATAVGNVLFLLAAGAFGGGLVASASGSRRAGFWAAVLSVAAIVRHGPAHSLQRDYVALTFALAGLWSSVRAVEGMPMRRRFLFAAGAAFGFAGTVKPQIGLLPLFALPVLFAMVRPRPRPERLAALLWLSGGVLLSVAVVTLWLFRAGGLGAFVDFTLHYTIPIFQKVGLAWSHFDAAPEYRWARIGQLVVRDAAGGSVDFFLRLAALGPAVAALVEAFRLGRWGSRALLAATCLAANLHYYVQGKGWEYHAFPAVVLSVLLLSSETARWWSPPGGAPRARGHRWGAALGAVAVMALMTAAFFGAFVWSPWVRMLEAGAEDLSGRLTRWRAEGKVVVVFDHMSVAPGALLRSRTRLPTPMLYDFMILGPGLSPELATPYGLALRERLVKATLATKPDVFVISKFGFPEGNVFRIFAVPELGAVLERDFHPVVNEAMYATWERGTVR